MNRRQRIEDHLALVEYLDANGEGFTAWEVDFVEKCLDQLHGDGLRRPQYALSSKQLDKIHEIRLRRLP